MSRPFAVTSHEGATDTGPGETHLTKTHPQLALYVRTEGFDPGTDTLSVQMEGSVDDSHFVPLNRRAPNVDNVLSVGESNFTESDDDANVHAAYVCSHSIPIETVRANITDHSGGFSVDTFIIVCGNRNAGMSFGPVETMGEPNV